jgi:hypothetical protein
MIKWPHCFGPPVALLGGSSGECGKAKPLSTSARKHRKGRKRLTLPTSFEDCVPGD